MATLKYNDTTDGQWKYLATGSAGPQGATGPSGPTGATGATGASGPSNITTSTNTNITGVLTGNGTAVSGKTNPSGAFLGTTDAQTVTNKRIDPRVSSTTSASSLTPTIASYDIYAYTALAANLTINAPTGTPVDGDKLIFRVKDNGTSRTLTWDAIFRAIGVTIPTATTASKTTYVGAIYNAADTKWDIIATVVEA